MFNFKITCDNGSVTVIGARSRYTAIKLYMQSEGCTREWFCNHCKCTKIKEYKEKCN